MTPPARRPIPALEGAGPGQTLPVSEAPGASALARLLTRGKVRATLYMLGPAFVASIAYVDPGNFATNVQGGAQFGYLLLWVVLAANLVAMLIQYLSAKLGIVTDRDLSRSRAASTSRGVFTWGMWVQAEIMAMSTDLAEFVGAALGLNLLFGVPLLPAGLMTGVIAFGILGLQAPRLPPLRARDQRAARDHLRRLPLRDAADRPVRSRLAARPDPRPPRHELALHRRRDRRRDRDAPRDLPPLRADQGPDAVPRRHREEDACCASSASTCYIALGLAGLVNMAMLAVAAKLFHTPATVRPEHDPAGTRPDSGTSSAASPRSRSRSRYSPPAPPPPASAPTPARS